MSQKGHRKLSSWPHIQAALSVCKTFQMDAREGGLTTVTPPPQTNWLKGQERGDYLSLCLLSEAKSNNIIMGWQVEINPVIFSSNY